MLLSQLFEASAGRSPRAVAVVDGTLEVTYAELERRANQMAHHLRRLGAGPETPVGICTGRSAGMVAALLGALKAGAAYVTRLLRPPGRGQAPPLLQVSAYGALRISSMRNSWTFLASAATVRSS